VSIVTSGGGDAPTLVDNTADVPQGHYLKTTAAATTFDIFTEGDVVNVEAASTHSNDGIWTVTEIVKDTDNTRCYLELAGRTMVDVGAENHTVTTLPPDGDRKVALFVPTTDGTVGVGTVAVWSYNQRASSVSGWKQDEITLCRDQKGGQAIYTYVDETLRVADRSFTNNSVPKWYGYIQRIQFKTAAITTQPDYAGANLLGWYESPTYLYPPTYMEVTDTQNVSYAGLTQQVQTGGACRIYNSAAITTDTTEFTVMGSEGTAASNVAMQGYFFPGKVYSFGTATGADNYVEFMLVRDVPTLELTTSRLKVYRAYGGVPVATVADGTGAPYGEAYDDIYERGRGWGVSLHDTTDDSGIWQAGTYEIWGTFIYDSIQESKPKKGDATFTIAADGSKLRVIISADKIYAPRITGGRVYIRLSESNDPLTMLADIDIVHGMRVSFDQNYKPWAYDSSNKAYAVEQNKTTNGGGALGDDEPIHSFGPNLDTYGSINGYDYQSDRTSIGKNNEGWKAAEICNRRMFLANVRLVDKSDTMNKYGERIMYSELGRYDTFPNINYIDVALGDFGEYVTLKSFADRLFGFKDSLVHVINVSSGSPDGWYLEDTLHTVGVRFPHSVCKTPYGIAWVNPQGCWLHNGQNIINLTENKIAKTEDMNGLLTDWSTYAKGNTKYTDPMIGYAPNPKHLIIMRSPGDQTTTTSDTFIYDFDTKNWTFTRAIFEESETYTNFVNDWDGNLAFGKDNDSNGAIFKAYDPTMVAQTDQQWTSKVFDFGNPATTKKVYAVYVTYRLTANQEAALKYSVGSASTYPLTTFTAFTNCSVNGTVGDGSTNYDVWVASANSGDSWEVAKFYNDDPISCDSIALRFDSNASCKIAISDITIEYRTINKRTS